MKNSAGRALDTSYAGQSRSMYQWARLESPGDAWLLHDWLNGVWTEDEERTLLVSGAMTAFWQCAYVAVLLRDLADGHGWEDPVARLRAREWLAKVRADSAMFTELASTGSMDHDELSRWLDSEQAEILLGNNPTLRASLDRGDYETFLFDVQPGEGLFDTWAGADDLLAKYLALRECRPGLDATTRVLLGAGAIALNLADSWLAPDVHGQAECQTDLANALAAALDATEALPLLRGEDGSGLTPIDGYLVPAKRSGCMVVGRGKRGYSVVVAASLVWLVHAQRQAEHGFFHDAFEYGSRAVRLLISIGSDRDALILGTIKGPERDSYMPQLRSWLEAARISGEREPLLPSLTAAVEELSFALEREMEQRLLSGEVCPDWLIDEVDYWAKVDAPSASASALQLRRDSAALRSDVLARAPLGPEPSRCPPIRSTLAYQMLKWAADECFVDYGDIDGLFRRLETDPANRAAAAGLFWISQCVLEHDPLDGEQVDPGLLPEWDEVHRLLLGPNWEKGVVLIHWDQILRLSEHPKSQADGFLDWAEPLAERDPAVVVMYGAAVLSAMVSSARERAGDQGILYYDEDLRLVIETVYTASRMLGDYSLGSGWPWGYNYYHGEVQQAHLECSVLAAQLLADIEWAWLEANDRNWHRAFVRAARALGALLDGSILIDGMLIPYIGKPFADASSHGAFAHVQRWFAAMLDDPSQVVDWGAVSEASQSLAAGFRADMSVRRSYEDDVPEWEPLEWAYWEQAAKGTLSRLTPDQLIVALRRHDKEQYRARLRFDVFFDTWEFMEPATQAQLIAMERTWYESNGAPEALGNIPNDLRKICELELRGCVYPFRTTIEHMLRDPALRNDLGLRSRSFDGISLGDLARLLGWVQDSGDKARSLRTALESTALTDKEREFMLVYLPRWARDLWYARNDSEHAFRWDAKRIARFRRSLLGIDCRGILPQLVRVKRKLRDSGRHASSGGTKI